MNICKLLALSIFLLYNFFRVIYIGQLKNTLNILVSQLGLIHGNLMECKKKSDNNFASAFVDYHVLPDINFNGHCSIK